ncbi:hypothetical protein AVEN_169935-1 [Araneus ventricosus]|uniref:Mos1 transposase HTH domain-containing protein n=1 Tax=Araneus ventricosus TaxID=182803 RepID=A0A4Y2N3E6_ARAVE|nr:hypothetical protein AVEN_169935-1 [Araneus ventricosus]
MWVMKNKNAFRRKSSASDLLITCPSRTSKEHWRKSSIHKSHEATRRATPFSVIYIIKSFERVMEQRMNLKFLYKLDKSAGHSHAMLNQVYEDDTVTLKAVYAFLKKFSNGLESVEDEHRSGTPPRLTMHGRIPLRL